MAAPSILLAPEIRSRSSSPLLGSILERSSAAAALLFCSPIVLSAAAVTWLLSGEPPFVAHRRIGRFGKTLWVPKLRTMWPRGQGFRAGWIEYLSEQPATNKAQRDPRVTSRFASFCRRHSIDELPQLLLVVSGRLRFVGPRPLTQSELDEHYGADQVEVLQATPGITGLWQVLGRNRLTYAQRKRLDLFFVRRSSWKLSLWIMLRTSRELLSPRDAW